MAYWPNPRRRLTTTGQPAALEMDSGGGDSGGADTGITYSGFDPYNDPATAPTTDPDYGSGGTFDPRFSGGGADAFRPQFQDEMMPIEEPYWGGGYGSPGGRGGMTGPSGGFGGLSFGAGLGISALSGLFSALGGILAAQEEGRQLRRLKQTPANKPGNLAATTRLAPPTRYQPTAPVSTQPMLGNPNAPQSQAASALQEKMKGLLTQIGSPQLKAARFGVGGF